ncbi:serpin family protein [uncultured Clostridium sp.]|uniref:serpin family protein n=1 Tax=uncultured Clostridium sp. TaxID=59620 RepID=UPI003216D612
MKLKKIISLMLVAIISTSLIGCEKFSSKNNEQISAKEVDKKVVEGNNKFAFNIFKEISKDESNKNVFISPLSISMALTMTYNGARENTKAEMNKVLGYEGMDYDKINNDYKILHSYLENLDENIKLNISNSIWIKEGEDINKEFININKDIFGAKVDNLDFTKPSSVDKINNWIEKSTNKMIKDMLKGPIDGNVIMYLINAIYFKGQWQDPFDTNDNIIGEFTNSKGEKSKIDFMRKIADSDKTFYGEKDDFQAIKMPYDSGKVSMYAVLPKEGLDIDSFINTLDMNKWNSIKKSIGKEKEAVNVSFPKFQIEYGAKELKEPLVSLGMKDIFSDAANLSGIREGIYVSSVLHQGKIEVNENGSEAAAVTIVEVRETAMPIIDETKEFIANRPFVFIIEDEESGTILFMGKLEEVKN